MSLGLPSYLAESTMSRALAHSANWFGVVCIVGAFATSVSLASSSFDAPNARYWLVAALLVLMGALLVVLSQRRTRLLSIAYLAVGGITTYVYAFSFLSNSESFSASNLFVIALPKMALVMVGGVGPGALLGVLWTTAGLIVAEVASLGGALLAGSIIKLDTTTLITYIVLVGVLLFDGLTRRTARLAQPGYYRAAREDRALEVRRELELRAAAHLHDTALSQLILIAESKAGVLDERLSEQISRDLHTLVDQDWLVDPESEERSAASQSRTGYSDNPEAFEASEWVTSELSGAIEYVRALGLTVLVSGDPAAVVGLEPRIDLALGQALRQCLINVVRHAGVAEADVTIVAAPADLTVIVVDDGKGFFLAPENQDSHHLGLEHSVRQRITSLGGTVEVWSQPGVGTSVMMSVPWSNSDAPPRSARQMHPPRQAHTAAPERAVPEAHQ